MSKATRIVLGLLLILSGHLSTQKSAKAQTMRDTKEGARPTIDSIIDATVDKIGEIKFEGLQSVAESDVLKAFREERVGISINSILTSANVEKAIQVIKELLAAHGYSKAVVDVREVDLGVGLKAITFCIDENDRVPVLEVCFEGNKVFTNQQLRDALKLYPNSDDQSDALLEYDLNNVRNFMRSHGYLQARIGKPQKLEVEGGFKVLVPLKEGPLFRVGEIKINGATLFTAGQIIELIGLKRGDIANEKAISDALYDKLNRLYANNGYMQFDATPHPEFKVDGQRNEGVVDFLVDVDEGRAFKIFSISFAGNQRIKEEELRRALLIREGDVFHQQLFQDSIQRLNGTGLFEQIDAEGHVDFGFNEEFSLVVITIKVREIVNLGESLTLR